MATQDEVILIVESDYLLRRVVADSLLASSRHVVETHGAEAAKALLHQILHIDMLVTNLRLPDGDGLALARLVRTLFPTVPILFITDDGEDVGDTERAIRLAGLPRPFGVMAMHEAKFRLRTQGPPGPDDPAG